jgi:hypothetical protein
MARELNTRREVESNYSEITRTRSLGPITQEREPLEELANEAQERVDLVNWQVMDSFDEGLRQSLIDWINTDRNGNINTIPEGSSRSKNMDFQFYGIPSKDTVGAGEIGDFNIQFKYTRSITIADSTNSSNQSAITR